jgi:hypothetical protein
MTLKINIVDRDTCNRLEIAADPESSIEELVICAADYWNKKPGAYILKYGHRILMGEMTIISAGLESNATLEFSPDPDGDSSP